MFKLIAIAGTFDRLHKGHRFFISEAFKLGDKVIIGLTSDDYVHEKFRIQNSEFRIRTESDKDTPGVARRDSPGVEEFAKRKRELENFLKEKGLLDRSEIVKIDDVYGPAIENNDIEALVVTNETMEGGEMVNRRRKGMGLKPLKLLKAAMVKAEDRRRIASTRIRLGEIDRWGRVYEKVSIFNFQFSNRRNRYKIAEELRQVLKKPQGILIKGNPENHRELADELRKIIFKLQPIMISTVGDEVTKMCNQIDIKPNLAIVDYRVMRKKKYHSLEELGFINRRTLKTPLVEGLVMTVKNPSGNITRTLIAATRRAIKSYITSGIRIVIKVQGEEDLAGLPAILLSPLGSLVIYGQPQEGVVVVEITEEKKQQLLEMMKKYQV